MGSEPKYWDNASTTKLDNRVFEAMVPFFKKFYGNASSSHQLGIISKKAVEEARGKVARLLNCFEDEIIFTSGATESINLALKGFVEANSHKGNHIITLKTEHKAVLKTCEYLEDKGIDVTYLDVDQNGLIILDDLETAIRDRTILISVMLVNNETGVIQPIEEIGKIARANNITLFTDATQAVGKIRIDLENLNVGMLSFSGHKLNGPKGIGVLYLRENIEVTPLIHGGGQEKGLRGGTYNTPLIVGLGKACEIAKDEFDIITRRLKKQKRELEIYFENQSIGMVNFKEIDTVPHILSITLNDFEAEDFLIKKSKEFMASTGSACNSGLIEDSHVLKAMRMGRIKNILRISI